MKISSISIQGFRGFNEERTIEFHDKLTLIYAPNSYGKTSMAEAFEWLMYGATSKVDMAESKVEYRGSYRNRHLAPDLPAFVAVSFDIGAICQEYRVELGENETIKRSIDGTEVSEWPFSQYLPFAPRPFILQHALKELLHAKPVDRFRGFARIMGLDDLDVLHQHILSLCTKPDRAIPPEVVQLRNSVIALESRLGAQPALNPLAKSLKKGLSHLPKTYDALLAECKRRLPADTPPESYLPQLLQLRDETVGKIFKGHLVLTAYSPQEQQRDADDAAFFLGFGNEEFIAGYMKLAVLATVQHIANRARFFELGISLFVTQPDACPLCGQSIDSRHTQFAHQEHHRLQAEHAHTVTLQKLGREIEKRVGQLRDRLAESQARHTRKGSTLLAQQASLAQIETIFLPRHEQHLQALMLALQEIATAKQRLDDTYARVLQTVNQVLTSITACEEDRNLIQGLGDALIEYTAGVQNVTKVVARHATSVSEADQILKHELDRLAGTEDLSILVEMLERWGDIQKWLEIEGILASLKELRKQSEQYVARKMQSCITDDLSTEVMHWYGQIRTSGDPETHFAGFDVERNARGDMKARRVEIKANSYGVDLASAVSSLSESKLNALGICMSIATNMRGSSHFDFLIIDDPIQSLDEEHETQFVEIIHELIDRGKQVVLLTHNRRWADCVRTGCRFINGRYVEITGYTKLGPHLQEKMWAALDERLQVVDAILKDPAADSIRLQQAEEEIRIVVADLTAQIYKRWRNKQTNPHKLNSTTVRKILIESGVQLNLVQRLVSTFTTTDPAHHVPSGYTAQRERVRKYTGWVRELERFLEQGSKDALADVTPGLNADVIETPESMIQLQPVDPRTKEK